MFSGSCSRHSRTQMKLGSASPSIVVSMAAHQCWGLLATVGQVVSSLVSRFGWNGCKSLRLRISYLLGPSGGLAMMSARCWAAFWSTEAKKRSRTWSCRVAIPLSANCISRSSKSKSGLMCPESRQFLLPSPLPRKCASAGWFVIIVVIENSFLTSGSPM